MNIWNITKAFMTAGVLLFSACQPDKFELGELLKKEDLNFTIVQDSEDPNAVMLEAKNSGCQPFWVTPMGRSTKTQDTIRLPFEGEYSFIYGIITRGGVLQADTFKVTITTTNLSYVSDPLWNLLTGGVGEEKTWYLDLNAEGESRYFEGPLYFYGTDDSWATVTEGKVVEGDVWNWQADWPGNQWIMPEGDYGSMTFSLKGNAEIVVDHKMLDRLETGTFFLDAGGKTIKMTDATPLHDAGREGQVIDWNNMRLMSLTENAMQLAVLRDEALSGDDAALFVYNYISKEYYDNWVPADLPEPEPEPQLPLDWEKDISQIVLTTISWKLSEENPLDWANLDGSRMNDWSKPEDYPDWLGKPNPSVYGGFSLTMNSADGTVIYTAPDGTIEEGTYTLDSKGIFTFENISPSFSIIDWARFELTAQNQLRILSIEKDVMGKVTGMWLGALSSDPNKNEYNAYHLVPFIEGGSDESDPGENIKNMLTAKTWKLDSERSYDVATSWGAEQGPVIFSDYSTWSWNPMPGEQYGAGEVEIDYGTMVFNADGTVVVEQRVRRYTYEEEGNTVVRAGLPESGDVLESDEVETLEGTWNFDFESMELYLTVGMLHPWSADYTVADWGDTKIYKIQDDALLLQVMRDEELSGEGAMPMTYVFVPVE